MPTPAAPDHLYRIDPATGATVNLDPGSPAAFSLDTIVDVNGTYYTFADAFGDLDTINLADGVTTTVGSFDPATTGLIFGAAPTPELSTIALIAFGLIVALLPQMRAVARKGRNLLRQSWLMSPLILAIVCIPAEADFIPITYSLLGTGTVVGATATTLTLDAQASGSVLSADSGLNAAWNPVSYSDQSVLDLTTNLLNGTFTLTFADGGTLTGTVFEDDTAIDTSPNQTGTFFQTLTFAGGTGEFAGATGSLSGQGFLGTVDFTVTGGGTLNAPAVPEPASTGLLIGGIGLLLIGGWRKASKDGPN
jgi:hypothetical protein